MTGNPRVLIIVLNWMKYDQTIACVHSLELLEYGEREICVIDNGSLNDSVDRIRKAFPGIHIMAEKKNRGYAAGNFSGVTYALSNNFDLVWILNNDTVVRPASLTRLVEAWKRHGDALYSNLTLMSENPDIVHYSGSYAIDEPLQPDKYPSYDKHKGKPLKEIKHLLKEGPARIYGHSMFIPLSVIRKYGFMDSRYFLFFEETDYSLSLHRRGIPSIFVPDAVITHVSTASYQLSPRMKYTGRYYYNRNMIFFEKRFGKTDYRGKVASKGGITGIVKYILKIMLTGRKKQHDLSEYYVNLGLLHGLLGIRGKILKPEKLLHD